MRPPEPSEPTLLGPESVHLWWGRVFPAPQGAEDPAGLSDEERSRSEAFRTPVLRARFVFRRRLLRRVLAGYLGLQPAELRFGQGEHGKPELDPSQGPGQGGELRFNLSHTGDWVLIALARGREVGVDVETLEKRGSLDGVAQRVFTEAELAELAASGEGPAWQSAFLRGWARKEAVLKALGTGLMRDPLEVQVGLEERRGADSPWPPRDETLAGWGRLLDLDAPAGHAAAVCAQGEGWRMVVRQGWEPARRVALGEELPRSQ